ncbi:hypothetical protein Hamer_G012458 [Homarus americanus]|uniref:Uncharacterized protein n=1 Tax=Homarus americanus TaxID=6706 RepID=A0A8J5KEQ5_HOMAM|nr:hypothetical protein Hamer_G012458 [Homarus americanus]
MVVNTGGNRDDSWLKGIVQQQQNAPTKRNVLIVYAQDVKHQILDLYDPMDLDKLSDGTMWLMRKLLHPATVTLLVASKEARRLQLQHTSLSMSAGQNLHGKKPQFTPETKNRKIQTEITPSQKTTLMNPTRDDKTGDMIFNHTFVQNTTEKNVYGLENNSPTIHAEVKPKEVSDIDSEEETVEGQENTTNRENTSLGCNNTNNFSDGKENGGTQDNTQAVTGEEGAFHFLLVDFLHKLESSFFSQDYKLAAEKELTQQTTAKGGIPV